MQRYVLIFPVLCAAVLFFGCQSKVLQMLIEPQEFYNYAITEGQGHLVVHIYFIYVCVFSSVGASCARDIAEKRQLM